MGLTNSLGSQHVYLDTNVFIYALEGYERYERDLRGLFEAIEEGTLQAATSELTLAETLVGPLKHGQHQLAHRYEQLLSTRTHFEVLPVTRQLLIHAARLRAHHPFLKLPDAIHAATAEQHDYPVFLTNDGSLAKVSGLDVLVLSEVAGPTSE